MTVRGVLARVALSGALLAVFSAATPATASAAPNATAQAVEPAVRVVPDTGIRPGSEVQVELIGFAGQQIMGLYQCDASVLDDPGSEPITNSPLCHLVHLVFPVPSGDSFTVTVPIAEALPTGTRDGSPIVHCGDEPGDCIVAAFTPIGGMVRTAPITVDPGPLAVAPADQLPGDPVHAFVTGTPSAPVLLAQCAGPVGPTAAASTCAPATNIVLDGTGRADTALTVEQLVGQRDCTDGTCVVALFDAAGTTVASQALTVYPRLPLTLSLDDSQQYGEGSPVRVTIENPRNRTLLVAQCSRTVAAGHVADGPCATPQELVMDRGTTAVFPDVVVRRAYVGADGSLVDCTVAADACVIAVQSDDGQFLTHGFSFAVPDVVTLSPATDQLEGQAMTLTASGLRPGARYRIMRCHGLGVNDTFGEPGTCDDHAVDAPLVISTPQGTLTTTVRARQRYTSIDGDDVYCRAQCQIALAWEGPNLIVSGATPYAMAAGAISASPSTGLVDRQTVRVTGSRLMPSYDGPEVGSIPTGRWALLQCAGAVEQDPTEAGVRRNCVVPSGGGVVEVERSDLSREVKVRTRIRPDGPAVDCKAATGACELVLIRLEQDATVTLHTAPIAFR